MTYHGHNSVVAVVVLIVVLGIRMAVTQRRRGMGLPGRAGRAAGLTSSADPSQQGPVDATGTGTAPGWFTDPFVRHEQRYWSGTAWTEHVLDGPTASVDPPPPPRG